MRYLDFLFENTAGTKVVSRIKSLRKNKGYTQMQLALLVGVVEDTIAAWESNAHDPPVWLEQVYRLCNVLECHPGDLIETKSIGKLPSYDEFYELHQDLLAGCADADVLNDAVDGLRQVNREFQAIDNKDDKKTRELIPDIEALLSQSPLSNSESEVRRATQVASRLSALRKDRGYTQRELALLVGVVESTIANWENGRSGLDDFVKARNLCKVLDCQPEDLIERVPRQETESDDDLPTLEELYALYNEIVAVISKKRRTSSVKRRVYEKLLLKVVEAIAQLKEKEQVVDEEEQGEPGEELIEEGQEQGLVTYEELDSLEGEPSDALEAETSLTNA